MGQANGAVIVALQRGGRRAPILIHGRDLGVTWLVAAGDAGVGGRRHQAAEWEHQRHGEEAEPMRLTDDDVHQAMEELVCFGGELTQKLLGYRPFGFGRK